MKNNNQNWGMVTPQQKLIATADKFGNKGIRNQQGTSRIIYDSLPLDGRTEFRFFEESNNRNFPRTNMGAFGNKMGVGETMAIERAYFSVVTFNPATGVVTAVSTLSVAFPSVVVGELNIISANSTTLKQLAILSFLPEYNKSAMHSNAYNFEFDTDLTLQPLLEFIFQLRTGVYTAIANTELRLTLEGVGSIISPRNTQ
jgi:hypothetical protein